MRIAIVGAGIIGVTTAWELASDGHQVQVFDRHAATAEESSFANAGVVAPGYVTPWAAPGMRMKVLRSLLSSQGAIKLRWPLRVTDLNWMRQWRRACELETYLANRARMQRLAFYSRNRLRNIVEACDLSYERSDGCLVLLRGKQEQQLVQPGLELLRATGAVFSEVDADQARRIEPALSSETELAGAIHLPEDEVGNCRQFALLLKREAEGLGAQFHFNCRGRLHSSCNRMPPAKFAQLHRQRAGDAARSPQTPLRSINLATPDFLSMSGTAEGGRP